MIRLRRIQAHQFKQLADVDLALPRRGRFLVRGLNEAGKSTLFEAVYFGLFSRPLATTSSQGKLEDLIHYRQEEALVRLEVELGDRSRLDIVRRIRRDRPNIWELDIHRPDGSIETVRGNLPVNQRIEAELQLDGEALLNTCFVEQKKLEKLEGQSRQQREESLMRLLNLDPLVGLEQQLKLKPADQASVERLRGRFRLATLSDELPRLQTELASLAERLAAHDRHDAALEASRLRRLADDAADRLADAEEAERRMAAQAEAAERYRQALTRLAAADAARERQSEVRAAIAESAIKVESATLAATAVVETMQRGRRLRSALERRECLSRLTQKATAWEADVRTADQRLATLAAGRQALNAVRQSLVAARAGAHDAARDLEILQGDLRAVEIRQTLQEWLAGERVDDEGNLDERRTSVVGQRQRLQQGAAARAGSLLLAAAGAAVVGGATHAAKPALAGVLAILAAAAAAAALAYLLWVWRRLAALQLQLARLEGEANSRQQSRDARQERRDTLRERFAALNAVPPADTERARLVLGELEERLGSRRRADIESALAAAQQAAATCQAEERQLTGREDSLRHEFGHEDGAALGAERDALGVRLERLQAIIAARREALSSRLATLGVDEDGRLETELGALRQLLATQRDTAARRGDVEAAHAALVSRAEALAAQIGAAWTELEALTAAESADAAATQVAMGGPSESVSTDKPAVAAPSGASTPMESVGDEDWRALRRRLEQAFAEAGGDEVRRRLDAATREAAALRERSRLAAAASRHQMEQLMKQLSERPEVRGLSSDASVQSEPLVRPLAVRPEVRGLSSDASVQSEPLVRPLAERPEVRGLSSDASVPELEALARRLAPPIGEVRAALQAEQDHFGERRSIVRHEVAQLSRQLGLEGQVLDAAAEQAELAAAERRLAVRDRASRLVAQASRRVMQSVLPNTLAYMTRLLPALTDDRYRDAQLSEDYRIEVYDERAGDWRTKNIFSGGTRDQFSLALRLSFALATLPEERGAAPGFLFLDEPLGAFDATRAQALVTLLTEGDLATSFDQIFLISHVPVDESLFDYHLALADGRVIESSLDGAESLEAGH